MPPFAPKKNAMKSLLLSILTVAFVASAVSASESVAEIHAPTSDATSGIAQDSGAHKTDDDLLDCCMECCCPCWTVQAGVVYWWRDQKSNPPILMDGGFNGEYFANEFDFMESPNVDSNLSNIGLDISLRHDDCCGCGTEIRYLRAHTSDNSAYGGVLVGAATNPPTALFNTAWNLNYESDVDSLEFLKHHCCGKFDLSYGLRYVNLDERLALNDGAAALAFNAENNLYGFQLGADGLLWDNCCGLRLHGSAKAGVYYNDADASGVNIIGALRGNGSDDNVGFVGELDLTAVYDVHCNLSLLAGYRLLVFDGVAIATNQVGQVGNLGAAPLAPVGVDWNTLFYHGLQVGVEYRY